MSEATATIPALIGRAAELAPETEALVFPDMRLTFRELSDSIDRCSRSLVGLGVEKGDHVGTLMAESGELAVVLLALMSIGAVPVPVNSRYKVDELTFLLEHADVRHLLVRDSPDGAYGFGTLVTTTLAARAEEAGRFPSLERVVDLGRESDDVFLAATAFARAGTAVEIEALQAIRRSVRPEDVALLLYTSGTTSRPKGCLISQRAIASHPQLGYRTKLHVRPGERVLVGMPLFHCGGIAALSACVGSGATFCHTGRFDVESALRFFERERCQVACAPFEPMWAAMTSHPLWNSIDRSALRIAMLCAPTERMMSVQDSMGDAVLVGAYGSTESCTNLTIGTEDEDADLRLRTVGSPVANMEVRCVDADTRQALAPGEVGEIAFRGDARLMGYYKDGDATSASIDSAGWFYSGDLGSVDADGYVRYNGRLKDMLKVGGENVAALEIEDFLSRMPQISIVKVTGVEDAYYGEVPAAFVELKPGARLTQEELQQFCLGAIATYKIPRYLRVVEEWPMSGTKVKKFELRARLEAELLSAGVTEAPRLSTRAIRTLANRPSGRKN